MWQPPGAPESFPELAARVLAGGWTMNVFRILGDLSHLLAMILLLGKIWRSKCCTGEGRPGREGGPRDRGRLGHLGSSASLVLPACRLEEDLLTVCSGSGLGLGGAGSWFTQFSFNETLKLYQFKEG